VKAPSFSATWSANWRCSTYRLDLLIERYGIDAKLFDWEPEADCPRKQAKNLNDQCGARCPDLSKASFKIIGRARIRRRQ
jgi:hypothetical protein